MSGRSGALLSPGAGLRSLFTPAPWRATAYLATYLVVGPLWCAFLLLVLALALVSSISWVGVPASAGAALVVRACAGLERARSRLVGPRIEGRYRLVDGGVARQARIRWTDPRTLRDVAYLILLFPVLIVADGAVMVIWLSVLAALALPAWYWSVPYTFPNGDRAHGIMIGTFPDGADAPGVGLWIGDLGTALLVALVALVLAVLLAPPLVAVTRLRVRIADRVLGEVVDPLAEAKRVLDGPGPLPRLSPAIRRHAEG